MADNRQFRRYGCETDSLGRSGTIMEKSSSRKVRQTRRALAEALVERSEEKPLRKISVRELCEAADINRSTFYAHYSDVFQLAEELETDFMEKVPFFSRSGDIRVRRRLTLEFVEYVQEHGRVFQMLLRNGYLTEPFIHRSLEESDGASSSAHRMLVHYTVSGTLQMLSVWLEEGNCSAETLSSWIYDIADGAGTLESRQENTAPAQPRR